MRCIFFHLKDFWELFVILVVCKFKCFPDKHFPSLLIIIIFSVFLLVPLFPIFLKPFFNLPLSALGIQGVSQ